MLASPVSFLMKDFLVHWAAAPEAPGGAPNAPSRETGQYFKDILLFGKQRVPMETCVSHDCGVKGRSHIIYDFYLYVYVYV